MAETSRSTVQDAVVTVALSPDLSLERPVLLNSRKLTILVGYCSGIEAPEHGNEGRDCADDQGKIVRGWPGTTECPGEYCGS